MELHSNDEYRNAMDELTRLRDAEPGTSKDHRKRELEAAVHAYDEVKLNTSGNKKGRPLA